MAMVAGFLLLPTCAWAYRPFVSTDAAVANPKEVEIELGYFNLERTRRENTFRTPSLVLNYGLFKNWEAVGELRVEASPEPPGVGGGRGHPLTVNPGQVVGAAQELFTVTDLSTVWVIGDLYEKDFANVRLGSGAVVTIPSAASTVLHGRVAYIDPRVDPATRTAKVRVEVPNRSMELRLGMYVNLAFQTGSGDRVTLVPHDAVQSIGERSIVYVPVEGDDTRFTERPVKLGPVLGDSIQVLAGLQPGERVVTAGSFFLRAEAGRSRSGG